MAPVSLGEFAAQVLREIHAVQHLETGAGGCRVVSAELELPFAQSEHPYGEILVAKADKPLAFQDALHELSLLHQAGLIDTNGIEAADDSKRGMLKIAVRLS